jgi:hypothetical protein
LFTDVSTSPEYQQARRGQRRRKRIELENLRSSGGIKRLRVVIVYRRFDISRVSTGEERTEKAEENRS